MKAQLLRKLVRKEVLETALYQVKGESCRVKLNQNESPFQPLEVEDALSAAVLDPPLNRYPDEGGLKIRMALANTLSWPAEGIAVANGSNVLVQALMITCAVNANVLSVAPTFPLYRMQAKLFGNKIIEVPLRKDFSLPKDKLLKTVKRSKPRLILLANPNAPTGNLFEDEAILALLEEAKCIVVLDEAYFPFSKKTFLPRLKEFPQLVLLRTFSKFMALAGLRLGYLLGDPDVVAQIEKVLLPFRLSQLTMNLGILGLARQEGLETGLNSIQSERRRVYEIMRNLKGISVYPSDANFLLFRAPSAAAAERIYQTLKSAGILVRNFAKSPRLTGCLRVTIGQRQENDQFLAHLQQILP